MEGLGRGREGIGQELEAWRTGGENGGGELGTRLVRLRKPKKK